MDYVCDAVRPLHFFISMFRSCRRAVRPASPEPLPKYSLASSRNQAQGVRAHSRAVRRINGASSHNKASCTTRIGGLFAYRMERTLVGDRFCLVVSSRVGFRSTSESFGHVRLTSLDVFELVHELSHGFSSVLDGLSCHRCLVEVLV